MKNKIVGSATVQPPKPYQFLNTTTRDAYFKQFPEKLVVGTMAFILDPLKSYMWVFDTITTKNKWIDTPAIVGPKGDKGSTGFLNIINKGMWDETSTYMKNQLVIDDDGTKWLAVNENVNSIPDEDNENWILFSKLVPDAGGQIDDITIDDPIEGNTMIVHKLMNDGSEIELHLNVWGNANITGGMDSDGNYTADLTVLGGVSFDGPYDTTASIPTPYLTSSIYLVGTAAPYEQYVSLNGTTLTEITPEPEPTNITSDTLDVGGTDFARTVELKSTTKEQLAKADKIDTSGDGSKILTDNGSYEVKKIMCLVDETIHLDTTIGNETNVDKPLITPYYGNSGLPSIGCIVCDYYNTTGLIKGETESGQFTIETKTSSSASNANVDLSNLSATGEVHFATKDYVDTAISEIVVPVSSVNGKTGDVELDGTDIYTDSTKTATVDGAIQSNTSAIEGLTEKTAILDTDGDGTKYLSDDGTYKTPVDVVIQTPWSDYLSPSGATTPWTGKLGTIAPKGAVEIEFYNNLIDQSHDKDAGGTLKFIVCSATPMSYGIISESGISCPIFLNVLTDGSVAVWLNVTGAGTRYMGYRYRESRKGLYDPTSATGQLPTTAVAVLPNENVNTLNQLSGDITLVAKPNYEYDDTNNPISFEPDAGAKQILTDFNVTKMIDNTTIVMDEDTGKIKSNSAIEIFDPNKTYSAGSVVARGGGIFKFNVAKPVGDWFQWYKTVGVNDVSVLVKPVRSIANITNGSMIPIGRIQADTYNNPRGNVIGGLFTMKFVNDTTGLIMVSANVNVDTESAGTRIEFTLWGYDASDKNINPSDLGFTMGASMLGNDMYFAFGINPTVGNYHCANLTMECIDIQDSMGLVVDGDPLPTQWNPIEMDTDYAFVRNVVSSDSRTTASWDDNTGLVTIDTSRISSFTPFEMLWAGGDHVKKIGEIRGGNTCVEFKYAVIGGQWATGGAKLYNLSASTDYYVTNTGKGSGDVLANGMDQFYTYANPDTGFLEIWAHMGGGQTRIRNLSYRVLRGSYVSDWSDGTLPDGAVAFDTNAIPPFTPTDFMNILSDSSEVKASIDEFDNKLILETPNDTNNYDDLLNKPVLSVSSIISVNSNMIDVVDYDNIVKIANPLTDAQKAEAVSIEIAYSFKGVRSGPGTYFCFKTDEDGTIDFEDIPDMEFDVEGVKTYSNETDPQLFDEFINSNYIRLFVGQAQNQAPALEGASITVTFNGPLADDHLLGAVSGKKIAWEGDDKTVVEANSGLTMTGNTLSFQNKFWTNYMQGFYESSQEPDQEYRPIYLWQNEGAPIYNNWIQWNFLSTQHDPDARNNLALTTVGAMKYEISQSMNSVVRTFNGSSGDILADGTNLMYDTTAKTSINTKIDANDNSALHTTGNESFGDIKTVTNLLTTDGVNGRIQLNFTPTADTDAVNLKTLNNVPLKWSPITNLFTGGSQVKMLFELDGTEKLLEIKYVHQAYQDNNKQTSKWFTVTFVVERQNNYIVARASQDIGDNFYYFINPDTGKTEIWVEMLGGYTRRRYMSYRFMQGNGNFVNVTGALPAGATKFQHTQEEDFNDNKFYSRAAKGFSGSAAYINFLKVPDTATTWITEGLLDADGWMWKIQFIKISGPAQATAYRMYPTNNTHKVYGTDWGFAISQETKTLAVWKANSGLSINTNWYPTNEPSYRAYVDFIGQSAGSDFVRINQTLPTGAPSETLIYKSTTISSDYTNKTISQWLQGQSGMPTLPAHYKAIYRFKKFTGTTWSGENRLYEITLDVNTTITSDYNVVQIPDMVMSNDADHNSHPVYFANNTSNIGAMVSASTDVIANTSGSLSYGGASVVNAGVIAYELRVLAVNDDI